MHKVCICLISLLSRFCSDSSPAWGCGSVLHISGKRTGPNVRESVCTQCPKTTARIEGDAGEANGHRKGKWRGWSSYRHLPKKKNSEGLGAFWFCYSETPPMKSCGSRPTQRDKVLHSTASRAVPFFLIRVHPSFLLFVPFLSFCAFISPLLRCLDDILEEL